MCNGSYTRFLQLSRCRDLHELIRLCKLILPRKSREGEEKGGGEGRGGEGGRTCTLSLEKHLKLTKCTLFLYRGMCVKPGYTATLSCWQLDYIHRICRGFTDADGKREFLFALPRFARDEVKT